MPVGLLPLSQQIRQSVLGKTLFQLKGPIGGVAWRAVQPPLNSGLAITYKTVSYSINSLPPSEDHLFSTLLPCFELYYLEPNPEVGGNVVSLLRASRTSRDGQEINV